jgi:hypothetical protein
MSHQLDALLAAVARAQAPQPIDVASCLGNLPDPTTLPSPWETWALIGLFRHRERQLWVGAIIRARLGGSLLGLAKMGALGHPEGVPQSGNVPGLPEWEYYFHGKGCCLTHKVDGDAIDVDFWDNSAEYFDTFFFINYLDSLRRPEPPEERLRQLHPATRSVAFAIDDLIAKGALTPLRGSEAYPCRVGDDVLAHADAIAAFCEAFAKPNQKLWLAALVGDWPLAHEAAGGHRELTAVTAKRAEECREHWRQRLEKELADPYRGGDALKALAYLEAAGLDKHLENALTGAPNGLTSAALDIIGRQDDPRWCSIIYDFFQRIDAAGQLSQSYLWIGSLQFLLRHNYQTSELLAALPRATGPVIGEAVLAALERAPHLALPLIRKALLADIPVNRSEVAAILGLINQPWIWRELLRALETSDDQEKTADARAALLECGDEECAKAVLAWEERNPHEDEPGSYLEIGDRRVGPFYSLGEISLKNRAAQMRYEMEKLRERVINLRKVVPPEPGTVRQ